MSKLHENNYINIQAFMVKDLNLKGNELLIYAIIYGFSQADDTSFTGGLQYLADWTNSTKQGVIKNLKSLVDKGYIVKSEKHINGIKFCEYRSTMFNKVLNNVESQTVNKVEQGIKQRLPNTKENINIDNIKNDNKNIISMIVSYLNLKAGTAYRPTTDSTARHIKARLNEGFTVENFYTVIDKKVAEWKGTDMEKYLRPVTLFGSKFESYLNAKNGNGQRRGANGVMIDSNAPDDLDGIL